MRNPQFDLIVRVVRGERIATVVDVIPDGASPAVREGLARHRLLAAGKPCPCGTQPFDPPAGASRGPGPVPHTFDHEPDCPAADVNLRAAVAAWQAFGGGR